MAVSFSIIVPVFNAERYLQACIDTLMYQLANDDEVILVNDGSGDNSRDICIDIAKRYPQSVCYIEQENKGASAARNTGLSAASKDYVLFIDSDDQVKQNYLSLLRSKLTNIPNIDVLMFGYETIPNGQVFYPGFSEGIKKTRHELLTENQAINRNNDFCFVWRFAVKRAYIKDNDFKFDEEVSIGEDYLFNARVLLSGGIIYVMREALYMYRINNADSTMSKKYKPDLEKQLLVQYNKKLEIIEQYSLRSVPGWGYDFSWYYITAFRDMLFKNIYNSDEKDKIRGLRRVLSLSLITDNYRTVGTKYWRYSKKEAVLHFCCKYRVFLRYVYYRIKKAYSQISLKKKVLRKLIKISKL